MINTIPRTIVTLAVLLVSIMIGIGIYFAPKINQSDKIEGLLDLGANYAKNNDYVYYHGHVIEGADVKSFIVLETTLASSSPFSIQHYAKDKNTVYYHMTPISNTNIKTFVALAVDYAKDKNHIYYQGEVVDEADPKTFTFIDDYYNYAKDKNYIFVQGKILDIDIDPNTFVQLQGGFIKDDKNVFYFDFNNGYIHRKVIDVDAATFEDIDICAGVEVYKSRYFRDKNHIYIQNFDTNGNPVVPTDIDILTFVYLGIYDEVDGMSRMISYSKDKNAVYYGCGQVLEGADVNTFIDLGDGYVKDNNYVWFLGRIIEDADVDTFQMIKMGYGGYAKDKNHDYYSGMVIDRIKGLSDDLATIVNMVYWYEGKKSKFISVDNFSKVSTGTIELSGERDVGECSYKDGNIRVLYWQSKYEVCITNTNYDEPDSMVLLKENGIHRLLEYCGTACRYESNSFFLDTDTFVSLYEYEDFINEELGYKKYLVVKQFDFDISQVITWMAEVKE